MRPLNGGRDIPAAPSGDGFASASSATTASPDDDAGAPPSTAGGSLSSTNNQRSRVPGAHAGASDADYSAGTGATCTARALLCRVSFRFIVLISGSCNCCCGQRVRPAGSCAPVPGRTTPPELLADGEEPRVPLDGPRPPAPPQPSSVAFASRVGHLFLLWSVEPQLHSLLQQTAQRHPNCAPPLAGTSDARPHSAVSSHLAPRSEHHTDIRRLPPTSSVTSPRVFELHSTTHFIAKTWWSQTCLNRPCHDGAQSFRPSPVGHKHRGHFTIMENLLDF